MKNVVVVMALVGVVGTAHADQKSDRAAIADTLSKLSTSAATLSRDAKALDDRGARKKFAPAASELADDLAALARRTVKDVPLKSIAQDASEIDKAADALVDLADEVEDKDERKALRSQATLIQQGVAQVRKSIDSASTAAAKDDKPAAPERFTGLLFNNSDACSWSENVRFVLSAGGQQVWKSDLVFPGRNTSVVLHKGSYLVQVLDTAGSKLLARGTVEATKEGWIFKSGCVNQD